MKNGKKVISFLLSLALILSSFTMTFADASPAAVTSSADKATVLNLLGLYSGTSTTRFEPDLGSKLTREQGVALLLRLMGLEKNALAMTDAEETTALSGYADTAAVSDWAKKYVAYGVTQGLVKGTSADTIGPKAELTGSQYSALILRSMGYGATPYESAVNDFSARLAAGGAPIAKVNPGALTRGMAVDMSYGTLSATLAGTTTTVIQKLVNNGVVSETAAESVGLTVNATPAVTTSSTGGNRNHGTAVLAVVKPTPSVSGGIYKTDQSVALSCGTPGSTIYYTLDDTTPSVTSIKYVSGSPIIIEGNVTLKAIGAADGMTNSDIMTEKYVRHIQLISENPTTHAISSVDLLSSLIPLHATSGDAITVTASGGSNLTYSIASGTVDFNGNPISGPILSGPIIDGSGVKYIFKGDEFDTILVTVRIGNWTETFTVNIT